MPCDRREVGTSENTREWTTEGEERSRHVSGASSRLALPIYFPGGGPCLSPEVSARGALYRAAGPFPALLFGLGLI